MPKASVLAACVDWLMYAKQALLQDVRVGVQGADRGRLVCGEDGHGGALLPQQMAGQL